MPWLSWCCVVTFYAFQFYFIVLLLTPLIIPNLLYSVRVSNELGRGNGKAAKFSVEVILYTSLAIGVFFWILCLAFGHQISYLFTSSKEVAKAVSSLSGLLAFSILLNNVGPVLSGKYIGDKYCLILSFPSKYCLMYAWMLPQLSEIKHLPRLSCGICLLTILLQWLWLWFCTFVMFPFCWRMGHLGQIISE